MKTHLKFIVALVAIVAVSACEPGEDPSGEGGDHINIKKAYYNALIRSYDPEIVLKWNETVGLAIENKMPTVAEARIYAMIMLAIHDALNMIIPKYDPYAATYEPSNSKGLFKHNIAQIADAAVSQAAHDVFIILVPSAKVNADNLLALCLSEIEDAELKTRGIMIGSSVASAILLKRQSDPVVGYSTFNKGTEPGIHRVDYLPFMNANPPAWPEKAVFGATFGSFTPFGIQSPGQFRPTPPFAVSSDAYAQDFAEVKKLGCIACPDRTAEQTEIGAFWKPNISGPMNTVARTLALQTKLNGWETARLLALTQMSQIDANIASFEGKYFYNFWLPISAVRLGDSDGNEQTTGDVNWTPSLVPPPSPDYPSTPATAGGAGAEIFRQFFKTDNKSFGFISTNGLPGVVRNYNSFSALSIECSLGRIYIGSHFRNSCTEGEKLGRKIGKYIYENNLKERTFPQ